jgi:hypothetical protein
MAKAPDRWHQWLTDVRFGGPSGRVVFSDISQDLLDHSPGEALDRVLSPREVTEFTAYLKPLVESGTRRERTAVAYLTAAKELMYKATCGDVPSARRVSCSEGQRGIGGGSHAGIRSLRNNASIRLRNRINSTLVTWPLSVPV